MKKVFKKLFLTLLGVSLIVAPLICCCFTQPVQAAVMESYEVPSCHQMPVEKADSQPTQNADGCDCDNLLSLSAKKSTQINGVLASSIDVLDNEKIDRLSFHEVETRDTLSISSSDLSEIAPPIFLKNSNLRL